MIAREGGGGVPGSETGQSETFYSAHARWACRRKRGRRWMRFPFCSDMHYVAVLVHGVPFCFRHFWDNLTQVYSMRGVVRLRIGSVFERTMLRVNARLLVRV